MKSLNLTVNFFLILELPLNGQWLTTFITLFFAFTCTNDKRHVDSM